MDIKKIGMIGVGSMGGRMTLMFAEYGIHVHFFDPSEEMCNALLKNAREAHLEKLVMQHKHYESLCKALGSPKAFVFSLPHGSVADKTIDGLEPYLEKGDLIMDAANEKWTKTERRQERLQPKGVHYLGVGVSGGYQSARRGPSLSPGGSKEGLDLALPFLQKIAAKDGNGRPCVEKLGPGGSGHYVKMVHNGIEQGMMSALCEAWGIMRQGLDMSYDDIARVMEDWNAKGPLRDNFLVEIGRDIDRTKEPKGGEYVLSTVRDKVVQDADDSEGTGIWTCEEAIRLHIPSPTILASHMFRIASADAAKREAVDSSFGSQVRPGMIDTSSGSKARTKLLQDLNLATYGAFLASFIQGMHIISKMNTEKGWGLNFRNILEIWRAGCIIRSNCIVDLLDEVYQSNYCDPNNLLAHPKIGTEFRKVYPALKNVVLSGMQANLNVPTLSATLEYYKYSGYTDLPTSFEEAELDYFGEHMFDTKNEGPGKPVKGTHHFEWHPAKGIHENE